MEGKKKEYKLIPNNSRMTLFRFELSQSQSSLFLILSLIGVIMLSIRLIVYIFFGLFDIIFFYLPTFQFDEFSAYYLWFFISNIISSILYLLLCIYVLRKILRNKNNKNRNSGKIIPHERIVNWLGLKISHGQSQFIFILSLVGILFMIQYFLKTSLFPQPQLFHSWTLFEDLSRIPGESTPYVSSYITDILLVRTVPFGIIITFFLLSLYSLIAVRRGKLKNPSKTGVTNSSLLIFIISIIMVTFLSARVFCHFALFNDFFSNLLGIPSNPPNFHQIIDFIITIILLFIFLTLLFTRYLAKEKNNTEINISKNLSWFHIKLNFHRATILLSAALFSIIFVTEFFLSLLFLAWYLTVFFSSIYNIIIFIILILTILFCYYPIEKILKNQNFKKLIDNIDTSREFRAKWFKFHLDRTQSIILFSVSVVSIVSSIIMLFTFNLMAQVDIDPNRPFLIFSYPISAALICIILVVIGYTIKKTYHSIIFH
ncbi:MAG: hypothetical protein ACFE9S_11950 [Candidatus Hermodarchaeota archaeon]